MGEARARRSRGGFARRGFFSPLAAAALLGGVAAHVLGFLVFRIETRPLPETRRARPFLVYADLEGGEASGRMAERARLSDAAPLFVPTRWNASQQVDFRTRAPAARPLDAFEPPVAPAEALRPDTLTLPGDPGVEGPADLLRTEFWRLFDDFAVTPSTPEPLGGEGPVAEVTEMEASGAPLRWLEARFDHGASELPSRPAEFLVRVGAGGLVSGPRLARGSGSDVFDRAARAWLAEARTADRLPAGYLRVRVFP